MVDFECATRYRDSTTLVHTRFQSLQNPYGTKCYQSLASHLGLSMLALHLHFVAFCPCVHFAFTHVSHRAIAPSRRDDLEALGFVFLFFLNGELPWEKIKAGDKRTRNDMMLRLKHETTVPELCEGAPPQAATALCKHLAHCRQLKFDQEPGSAPCSDALW